MKREILFRGKCIKTNEWVYGSLLQEMYNCYISKKIDQTREAITQVCVDPQTVSQFTGLTDKNGVKIFEGDKLKITVFDSECLERTIKYELIEIVLWHNSDYYFYRSMINNKNVDLEIIGNIHE